MPTRVIYGINAVAEALHSRGRSIQYVAVARERHDTRVQSVVEAARKAGVVVRPLPREDLGRIAGTDLHQGVVAVGAFREDGTFEAKQVLAKHDEKYMPPDLAKALKAQGEWRGDGSTPDYAKAKPST